MRINTKILVSAAIAAITVAVGCQKDLNPTDLLSQNNSDQAAPFAPSVATEPFMPNEILVKFKPNTSLEEKNMILEMVSGQVIEVILTKAMQTAGEKDGIYHVHTPLSVTEAVKVLKLANLAYAEPNFIYTHFASSNDSYFTSGSLWGMYGSASSPSNAYGSGAALAWGNGNTGSSDVYVGIIDEGYMYTHEDIAANAGKNPGEIAGNRKDDDGNGFVDDVYGWDFAGNNNTVFDGVNDDHGTHVAGTIGGVGGNGKGVAGVCWNVKLLNAKFLGNNGGTTANAVKAVDYFTALKKAGVNIVATNNSWGGGGYSQSLYDAIDRANTADILFVAAAGNNGTNNDVTASYPAGYSNSNIIAVAAIAADGSLASFSQYGANTVDIGAPGVSVWSSIPKTSKKSVTSSYASYSGTSMATPHVTGACALYKAANSGASAATIKAAILNSAISTSSLSGKCVTGGRLDVSGF